MINAPLLFTERLVLRGPEARDFEQVAAFMASQRAEFVGGPMDRWNAYRGFAASIGHWVLRGFGFYTLCLKTTGEAVGRVGIIYPETWPEPELGWQSWDNGARQGYVTEAARSVRAHAAQALGIGPMISFIDPRNAASIRVAERLGCVPERETMLVGNPCVVWRHPAEAAQ